MEPRDFSAKRCRISAAHEPPRLLVAVAVASSNVRPLVILSE